MWTLGWTDSCKKKIVLRLPQLVSKTAAFCFYIPPLLLLVNKRLKKMSHSNKSVPCFYLNISKGQQLTPLAPGLFDFLSPWFSLLDSWKSLCCLICFGATFVYCSDRLVCLRKVSFMLLSSSNSCLYRQWDMVNSSYSIKETCFVPHNPVSKPGTWLGPVCLLCFCQCLAKTWFWPN